MVTFLAVVLRILSNPLANVFQKQLAINRADPLFINFVTYLFLGILSAIYAVTIRWVDFPDKFWLYSLAVGFLGALGNGFLVKALQQGDLSVLGPVNAYKAVVSLVVAFFLLGEVPGIPGGLGIGLIVAGSYVVLNTTKEKLSWGVFKRTDIQYRLLAMFFAAVEAVLIKKVINYSSPEVAFIIWCWFGALFSFALFYYRQSGRLIQQIRLAGGHISTYVMLIFCIGLMQFTTNYTFGHMPVAYALALFQLSALISVLLGHRFFKETDILKKLVGATIMVAGSALIILFNK
jgi:drug/metabolite transporter (DMT)-like permease